VYQPLVAELAQLGGDVSVYAVAQMDGRAENEPDSVQILAAACVKKIMAQVTGPIGVYGHCTGSFLALEIVRQLEAAGRDVKMLLVAGTFPYHWGVRLMPFDDPWRLVSNQKLHDLMKSWGARKDDLDEATLNDITRRFRRDARLAFMYEKNRRPWRIAAPIVNIVSADDPLTRGHTKRFRRWEKLSKRVRLFVLKEGGHYFVSEKPGEVARIVRYAEKEFEQLFAAKRPSVNGAEVLLAEQIE